MTTTSSAAARFEPFRALLVRHAYRMLGSFADAEDIAQEAYLRFEDALARTVVRDERAFLRATVTRLCLDKLRSPQSRRETYVGPWLPEFVLADSPDPDAATELADDVSMALLLALERLAPLERAAFLLHDALGVPFDEVAHTLGRSEPAVRKLASRAREHVHEANRRSGVSRGEALALRDAFLAALRHDDAAAMERLIASDVIFTSDGGGKASAALVPVFGRDRVSRLLFGLMKKGQGDIRDIELAMLNGLPGIVTSNETGVTGAVALEISTGKIVAIYAMRNPDKLRLLSRDL